MNRKNSYTVTSIEKEGDFSVPEIQNMRLSSVLSVQDTVYSGNGYGLIQAFIKIIHTRRRALNILELWPARQWFFFWRDIRDGLPETSYTGFDHLGLPNIDTDDKTRHVVACWPHNASRIETGSIDILYHHALWPQIAHASQQNYADEVSRVLWKQGIYIGVHAENDIHPFMLSPHTLRQADFQATAEIVVENSFAAQSDMSWADLHIRAVIAEK
jgi:hypothetical protein